MSLSDRTGLLVVGTPQDSLVALLDLMKPWYDGNTFAVDKRLELFAAELCRLIREEMENNSSELDEPLPVQERQTHPAWCDGCWCDCPRGCETCECSVCGGKCDGIWTNRRLLQYMLYDFRELGFLDGMYEPWVDMNMAHDFYSPLLDRLLRRAFAYASAPDEKAADNVRALHALHAKAERDRFEALPKQQQALVTLVRRYFQDPCPDHDAWNDYEQRRLLADKWCELAKEELRQNGPELYQLAGSVSTNRWVLDQQLESAKDCEYFDPLERYFYSSLLDRLMRRAIAEARLTPRVQLSPKEQGTLARVRPLWEKYAPDERMSFAEACRLVDISRTTGYKFQRLGLLPFLHKQQARGAQDK